MLRPALGVLAAAALAACVSSETPGPSREALSGLRITETRVAYERADQPRWGAGETAFRRARGIDTPIDDAQSAALEARMAAPEARAFLRSTGERAFAQAVAERLGPRLSGPRPARLEVTVHDMRIPSEVERVVNPVAFIDASAVLREPGGGRVLATIPRRTALLPIGGGWVGALASTVLLPDPKIRLADAWVAGVANDLPAP